MEVELTALNTTNMEVIFDILLHILNLEGPLMFSTLLPYVASSKLNPLDLKIFTKSILVSYSFAHINHVSIPPYIVERMFSFKGMRNNQFTTS